MKKITITLVAIFLILSYAINTKAQNYGTLNYWGKEIKLDREFFKILNNNSAGFMEKVKDWRYYNFKDYNNKYISIVDNLKSYSFTIIVTEANTIQTRNSSGLPDSSEQNKDKKGRARAGWLYYYLLLPSLQEFANGKI